MRVKMGITLLHGILVAFMVHQCRGFIVGNSPVAQNATCSDSKDVCDFLNMTYSICNNTQLAREHCQLFCNLCDAVDGHWSDWGLWSGCDVTCGNGARLRVRSCNNPAPVRGGIDCVGSDNEQDVCVLQICPVHGGWSEWTVWGACSASCEVGLQRRDRNCNNPLPSKDGNHCFGDNINYRVCDEALCKVHGGWSGWSAWGSCSASCGIGLERRDRSCDNPWPSNNGNQCNGDNINYRVCTEAICTDGWDRWSDWSSCSVTCGPGFKHRYRTCNDTIETILGGGCVGNDQEYTECNMKSCEMIVLFYADGPRNTNISINETIVYSSVTTNIGGGYNSSSGVFIAPHEGLFLFTSQTCIQAGNSIWVGIVKDGAMIQDSMLSSTKDDTCNSMQAAVQLRVEERVWIQGTWTSVLFENYYRRCSFSGMLIQ